MLKKVLFILIPLNLIFDILLYFDTYSILPYLRGGLIYFFFLIILFHKLELNRSGNYILLFVIYVILQFPFSNDFAYSVRLSARVFAPLVSFIIAYSIVNSYDDIIKLNKSVIVYSYILILNFFISNYYNIGVSVYTEGDDFNTGNLYNAWFNYSYAVLLVPIILPYVKNKFNRLLLLGLFILLSIIVLISIKRGAILTLVIGFFIFIYFSQYKIKYLKLYILAIAIFVVTYPLYEDLLQSRFQARESKFEDQFVEKEARYVETINVWKEAFSFSNVEKSFFGLQAFYSVGNYENPFRKNRPIHVDFNVILNTTGIIGLLIYLLIHYNIYLDYRRYRKVLHYSKLIHPNIKPVFYVMLITPFFTAMSGGLGGITFRSIIFIYLGAILKVMKVESKKLDLSNY